MKIPEKMLKAYFHVAEKLGQDDGLSASARAFHRTKKIAFFVEARRLNKDGLLPGEGPYQEKNTISK